MKEIYSRYWFKSSFVILLIGLVSLSFYPHIFLTSYYAIASAGSLARSVFHLPVYLGGDVYRTGMEPAGIAFGDIDSDGFDDIIVTNMGDDTVYIYSNKGGRNLVVSQVIETKGAVPRIPLVADIDGDGLVDLVVPIWGDGESTIEIYKNIDGVFAYVDSFSVGYRPRKVAAADLDNDGDVDLVTADNFSDTLTIIENFGGEFQFRVRATLATQREPGSVSLQDVDGDTYVDIVATMRGSDSVMVWQNRSTFDFELKNVISVPESPKEELLLDFDEDGDLDIVAISGDGNAIVSLMNVGLWTYELADSLDSYASPHALARYSIKKDNRFFVTAEYPNSILVYLVTMDGKLSVIANFWVGGLSKTGILYVAAMDLNHDDWVDLVVTKVKDNEIEVLKGGRTIDK